MGMVAAALLGAVSVVGFAPLEWFPVPLFALALLLLQWRRSTRAGAVAWLGFAWGFGFFMTGVSWVYVSLHDVGGMATPLAALATLLFCAYLALFPALAGWAWFRLRVLYPDWRDGLLFAVLWTATEWLRGWLFTGFPWLALGYSQTPPSPLAGFAPLLGIHGVTFATAFAAGLLSHFRGRSHVWLALFAMFGIGAGVRQVSWTEPDGQPISVNLLQGNIPQSIKWDPQRLPLSVKTYVELAGRRPAQLTILPETAIPLYLDQIPEDWLRRMAGEEALILGVALRNDRGESRNAAMAWSSLSPPQLYAKRHLVPFGEFIPPGFAWFFDFIRIPMSNFTPGPSHQAPLQVAGTLVAVNICYEDLFAAELIEPLPSANLLVNLSNTAWFGHSLAQPQHLQISRMRALETGRPMLRATNTGMTAAIDPDGTVRAQLEPFSRSLLSVEIRGYRGETPFVTSGGYGIALLMMAALFPCLHKLLPLLLDLKKRICQ